MNALKKLTKSFLFRLFLIWFSFLLFDLLFRIFSGNISIFWKKYFIMSVGFSFLWSLVLTAIICLLPRIAARIFYVCICFINCIYLIAQFIYHALFDTYFSLNILSLFSEGMDYAGNVLKEMSLPLAICFVLLFALIIFNCCITLSQPVIEKKSRRLLFLGGSIVLLAFGSLLLPNLLGSKYYSDWDLYKKPRYIYDNFLDTNDCMMYAGTYQYFFKDLQNIYGHRFGTKSQEAIAVINDYYDGAAGQTFINDYTGLLADKNVILVMMESIDDWVITPEDTPTLYYMMNHGMNFTNFYSSMFGSGATFNTEFCINTGLFSPTTGESASGYYNNAFPYALPRLMREDGYTANSFHYNVPDFYNRDRMHEAFGYENYYCYQDYVEEGIECRDDSIVAVDDSLYHALTGSSDRFFSFIITYSGHLPYEYSYELCQYALERAPECNRAERSETENCMAARARMTDDMFTVLLKRLEEDGLMEDTVIIVLTDHYTYAIEDSIMSEIQPVEDKLLYQKTPFFIYGADVPQMTVDKVCNTQDVLPTVANLLDLGISPYYLGNDILSADYSGYAFFPNGAWITDDCVYNGTSVVLGNATQEEIDSMNQLIQERIMINNNLLLIDYFED